MALMLALAGGGCTSTRHFATPAYVLPTDRSLSLLVMRPDVSVGSATAGGMIEPNADWTRAARANLAIALDAEARAHGLAVSMLPDQTGEDARLVADYEALHRSVATAIASFKYGTTPLPTKRTAFDWTLGPEAGQLARLGGGSATHALFLSTQDAFATSGRRAMQVMFALLGGYVPAGQHLAYASLVDLRTGDVVWFNVVDGSAGDIRTPEGARTLVAKLLKSLPKGEAAP